MDRLEQCKSFFDATALPVAMPIAVVEVNTHSFYLGFPEALFLRSRASSGVGKSWLAAFPAQSALCSGLGPAGELLSPAPWSRRPACLLFSRSSSRRCLSSLHSWSLTAAGVTRAGAASSSIDRRAMSELKTELQLGGWAAAAWMRADS